MKDHRYPSIWRRGIPLRDEYPGWHRDYVETEGDSFWSLRQVDTVLPDRARWDDPQRAITLGVWSWRRK